MSDNPQFVRKQSGAKRKPIKKERSCALCKVVSNSQQSWKQHLEGRKHKAKEAALVAETRAKKNPESLRKQGTGKKKPIKEELSCALCKVVSSNESSWKQHLEGRKHKAKEAAALIAEMKAEKKNQESLRKQGNPSSEKHGNPSREKQRMKGCCC